MPFLNNCLALNQVENMQQPLLQLYSITKTFPGAHTLVNISLDVFPGAVHALLGENGAIYRPN
jgi:ABC-type sugar transport system ATPase subunit